MKKQFKNFQILAYDYAQYKTIKNWDCIDKNNAKIPWYTYPAIEYLNNLDFTEKTIFEYGSGNSSVYWSKKAKEVISLEHDKKWFEKMKTITGKNQVLLFEGNNSNYEQSILYENKKFDVIIIDGIRRTECSKVVGRALNDESSDGYMIILDNADWYKQTSKYLRGYYNLIEIDFHGFGPINAYTWTTSIFLSRNFNFKPINDSQPHFSIAGLMQSGE